MRRLLLAWIFLAGCMVSGMAQPTPLAEDPNAVMNVFDVRHRDASELFGLIRAFIPGSNLQFDDRQNLLIFKGSPAHKQIVEELLRRFDVPQSTVSFQIYILLGSKVPYDEESSAPQEISQVLSDVASLTEFKHFYILASPTIRVLEGKKLSLDGVGRLFHQLEIGGVEVDAERIHVDSFSLFLSKNPQEPPLPSGLEKSAEKPGATPTVSPAGRLTRLGHLQTAFDIADGESIVLASSQLGAGGDNALITVLTAHILK